MNLTDNSLHPTTVVYQLTDAQLKEHAKILAQEIIKAQAPPPAPKKNRLLTTSETCERLGIQRVTLWQWDKKCITEPVRVGTLKRYRESDIEAIIEKKGGK